MNSNIGIFDRYVRLAGGLVLLGSAMTMSRKSTMARMTLLGLGAMKVAEGATGWCPLTHLSQRLNASAQPVTQTRTAQWPSGPSPSSRDFAQERHSTEAAERRRANGSNAHRRRASTSDSAEEPPREIQH